MEFTETALLASIDHTLASVRAALFAGADPEQIEEARTCLAEKAGEDTGRLVAHAEADEWPGVDTTVFDAIKRAGEAGKAGDLPEMERRLAAARETLGGRSR